MIKGKKLYIIILSILLVLLFSILVYFSIKYFKNKELNSGSKDNTETIPLTLDKDLEDNHLSRSYMTSKYGNWRRDVFFYWNQVEEVKGVYDWSFYDKYVKEGQEEDIYSVFIIMPYANWDQDSCHGEAYLAKFDPSKGGDIMVGKPCDMDEYKRFLTDLVDRYDGDGKDDMPGLKIPIKYWEIMNEPNMQGGETGGAGEELKFFVGTPQEYLDILKVSYETIKNVDPEAKVVQGGMAGMQDQFLNFWEYVFENGGGNYIDVANIHAISIDENTMDLFVIDFKKFLKRFDLDNLPIFVTESQIGSLNEEPEDYEAAEDLIVESTVFALASGADKIMIIYNWEYWGEEETDINKSKDEKEAEGDYDKIEESGETTKSYDPIQYVYETLVKMLDDFDTVTVLSENIEGSDTDDEGYNAVSGQYKFESKDEVIYVVWGEESALDESISGSLEVIDIYGDTKIVSSEDFVITDRPVYIKINTGE